MIRGAAVVRWLRSTVRTYKVQLAFCLRVTTAAVLTLVLAQGLHLPLYLWAVLTAVILTQISSGRSLKATIDYLIGTLGGVIYAGAVGVLVPHTISLRLPRRLRSPLLLSPCLQGSGLPSPLRPSLRSW